MSTGLLKGLAAIRTNEEKKEAAIAARKDFVKVDYFQIKGGESVTVRFLQELDPEAENYNEEDGVGFVAIEHSSPVGQAKKEYWRKALCTADDEGSCAPCAEFQKNYKENKAWKAKERLYINVLVNPGTEDEQVVVLNQGTWNNSITPGLIDQATEFGTILDRPFKISRKGSGFNDTQYTLLALKEDKVPFVRNKDLTLFDLDEVINQVPFEDQREFYLLSEVVEADDEPVDPETVKPDSKSSTELDW